MVVCPVRHRRAGGREYLGAMGITPRLDDALVGYTVMVVATKATSVRTKRTNEATVGEYRRRSTTHDRNDTGETLPFRMID